MTQSRLANALPPNALAYMNLRSGLAALVGLVAFVALIFTFFSHWPAWILPVGSLLIIGLAMLDIAVLNRWEIRNTSYVVSPTAVHIQRGALFRRDSMLAGEHVLNVVIAEGPLLARFGLATIQFKTIADTSPLGPVTLAQALAIRADMVAEQRVEHE